MFREIERRGVRIESLAALEAFGGAGNMHMLDYARRVAHLTVWEHDPEKAATLRQRFPTAEVRTTDSYAEVKRATRSYDLLVLDAPEGRHGGHYEHLDLFDEILRLASDPAVIVLTVRPGGVGAHDPFDTFEAEHLERRRVFYGSAAPAVIPLDQLAAAYRTHARAAGFAMEWHFTQKRTRSGRLHYLVFKLRRVATQAATG
jgi:hypothetical protein